jgi:hypothetical protein
MLRLDGDIAIWSVWLTWAEGYEQGSIIVETHRGTDTRLMIYNIGSVVCNRGSQVFKPVEIEKVICSEKIPSAHMHIH